MYSTLHPAECYYTIHETLVNINQTTDIYLKTFSPYKFANVLKDTF